MPHWVRGMAGWGDSGEKIECGEQLGSMAAAIQEKPGEGGEKIEGGGINGE